MAYADYEFYTDEYFGGSIEEADWARFAERATDYINSITFGRAERSSALPAVKKACCAVAEEFQTLETTKKLAASALSEATTEGVDVQSESVGSWSRTYRSAGSSAEEMANLAAGIKAGMYAVAYEYLRDTGLLYRGVRCTQ